MIAMLSSPSAVQQKEKKARVAKLPSPSWLRCNKKEEEGDGSNVAVAFCIGTKKKKKRRR